MPLQCEKLRAGLDIPYIAIMILATGDQACSIRRKRNCPNRASMFKRLKCLTRVHIPYLYGGVIARGRSFCTIIGKCNPPDALAVPGIELNLLARAYIPDSRGSVLACTGNELPIW